MASGTITGTTNNEYITPTISWSSTPNTAGNYSDVTVTLYYKKSSASTASTYGTLSYTLTINGEATSGSKVVTLAPNNTNVTIVTATVRVTHNSNGAKSITISATGGIPGTSFTSTSCSSTVALDVIVRASTPTVSSSSVALGSTVTISTNRANATLTHRLTYMVSGQSSAMQIATGVEAGYNWTPPASLASAITSGKSAACTITCYTYADGSLIGSNTVSITLRVPNTSAYTPGLSVSATNTNNTLGAYVAGLSKLSVTVQATAKYGASITSISVRFNGVTYTSSTSPFSFTTTSPTSAGTYKLAVTIEDSRGYTTTSTTPYSFVKYSAPYITKLTAVRCNSSGAATAAGAYIKINFRGYAYATGSNRIESAGLTVDNTAVTVTTNNSASPPSATVTDVVRPLATNSSATIVATLTDTAGKTATKSITVPTVVIPFNIKDGGTGAAFGKFAETANLLESAWPIKASAGFEHVTVADLDDAISTGFYIFAGTASNKPTTSGGVVIAVKYSANYAHQLAFVNRADTSAVSALYYRRYYSGSWSNWLNVSMS